MIGLPNFFNVSKITMGNTWLFHEFLSRPNFFSYQSQELKVPSGAPKLTTGRPTANNIPPGQTPLPTSALVATPPQFREAQTTRPSGSSSDEARLVSEVKDAVMTATDSESESRQVVDSKLQSSQANITKKVAESASTAEQGAQETNSCFMAKQAAHGPAADASQSEECIGTVIARIFRGIVSCFTSIVFPWQSKQPGQDAYSGKDISKIFRKLQHAVEKSDAEATELLLKKVLELNPDYSTDVPLTAIAAQHRRADVLEILVKNGMALPARAESWSRYGEAIGDYLRWRAACRRGVPSPEVLSCVAQILLVENHLNLKPEFNCNLNGRALNEAQKAYSVEALVKVESQAKALVEVDAKIYTEAGFTQETAKAMADGFNANASRYIARTAGDASATLARAVSNVFDNFKENGAVWPYLRKYLMNMGMYGILADLVVTALDSAAEQSMAQDADREMLLADALEKCAGEAEESLDDARNASGDPDLFHKLLSPQLHLLLDYCDAQRKRKAATTSGQTTSSAGAD